MTSPRKFLFDTSFEPGAKARAPNQKDAKPVKTYSEEELTKAREEGFAAGKEAGQKAAADSFDRQVAQALTHMTQHLTELGREQAAALERRSREAIEAALAIIRKLFPRLAQDHGMAEIETIVSECLIRLHDEPRVVIRVADPLLDAVQERVGTLAAKAGFEGKVVLIAQEDLKAGDVRVEWADGGAERDSGALWREIDGIVERVMGPPQTAPAATADTTQTNEADRPRAVSQ